jgi:hypothetical protein
VRKRLIKVTTVRAAKRFIAALVGMPSIAFIIAIIFPSQAYADDIQSDQGGAGQNTNLGSSASSEVVQQDPSVVSAQGTVTEASTAVATAESAVTTLETKVTQLTEVASSLSQPAQVVTTAVQSATNSVETASAATESAATAVSTAETAIATSQTANQTLAQATSSVTTQTAVVTTAQTTLTQASAAVDSQEAVVASAQSEATSTAAAASAANTTTTVTETFANNTTSVVTVTTGSGVFIGGSWNTAQTSGPGLVIQYPANDVVIDVNPSNTGTVTSVTMGVYAKNGDTTMTATNTDGSTTTTIIDNNVSSATQAVGYTSTETITGSSIETLTITKDADYYIIDNIAITKTSSDPALTAAAQQAATTLSTEQGTLTTLQTAETTATTNLSTQQGTLTTLQTAESAAQTAATTATATMQTATTTALSSAETATASVAEAVVIVAVAQVVVSSAAIETASAALETVVTTSDGLPLQKPEIIAVVDAAVDAVVEAQEAIETATASMQTAETLAETAPTVEAATAVVADKTEVLAQAQAEVDAQEVVVAQATSAEAAAQSVVDAATTPGLKVEVYSVAGQNNAPVVPQGATPIHTTTDTNGISEQWGGGAVAGSNRAEDVVVKYTGTWTPSVEVTHVYAPADDGVKLYLDGQLVINDWYDKGGGGSVVQQAISAGTSKAFELWYYENGGGAGVWFYRYNNTTGYVIAPGSEFTQSSATTQQLQALATAEATLTQEQDELEVLDLQEDVAQQNLLGAQQNLVVAQAAVTAMETAVSDAQTAITKTVEAIAAVQTAQTTVQEEVILQSPIEAPSNIVVTQLENGDVQVSWDPPSGIISPERYAISWSVGDSGWGIATGNAGDANALNTSIVLSASLFESTGGLDTTYQISVRSDNDSLAKYSSVVATQILIADPTPEPPTPPVEPPVEPPTPPVEPEEPPVEPEEPPVEPEEPPVEPEEPPVEPEEPPVEPEEPPVEPEEPPVEPEEPPVEPEEPPVEPEEPPVEPEEPPVEPEEPPVEEPEPTQEEVVDTAVEDALGDGKITAADAEEILDALNADGEITSEEVNNLSDALAADGKLTESEKDLIADALIESVAPGETLTKEQIQDAGIAYEDLPPETPVEVRQDANGNEVVITAEVAAALEVLANPVELLSTMFDDPAQALLALGSIGADMSDEERQESTEAIVATVIAAGAAMNAVAAAASGSTGGSTGGSSGGGSSGGGGPSGDSRGVRRRPKP